MNSIKACSIHVFSFGKEENVLTLNFVHVHCTADDGSDYFDVGGVELYDDTKVIDRIRRISDTTVDKLTFTVSTTVCMFTSVQIYWFILHIDICIIHTYYINMYRLMHGR